MPAIVVLIPTAYDSEGRNLAKKGGSDLRERTIEMIIYINFWLIGSCVANMIIASITIIMMKTVSSLDSISRRHVSAGAFSLVELLVVVGAIATASGIGVVAVHQAREASATQKLESDVGRINQSVRTYLANGGTIPNDADAEAVLARLKSKPTAEDAKSLVGVGGPFIDERIGGVASGGGFGPLRATWNQSIQRFELTRSGEGFTSFHLHESVDGSHTTEARSTAQKFSHHSGWVWDFENADSLAVVARPAELATSEPDLEAFTPQGQPGPQRLRQPEFSIPAGLYPYADFPLGVEVNNPNPRGSSMVFYSLNNGSWTPYNEGTPLSMPRETLTSSLRVYAAAVNSEEWHDSSSSESLYKTIFFKGATTGVFHSPVGEASLVTNLTHGLTSQTFTWGRIASGYTRSNSMTFTPAANFTVVPDQEFKLGDLYYYNGTVVSGTSATGVKLRFGLNFSTPARTETFEFDFRLYSTINRGESLDADADYVWIPQLSSEFTAQVQGQTFYLQLRFGNSTANGFTTIDEFHVHENKSATGAIYGKFTTSPTW